MKMLKEETYEEIRKIALDHMSKLKLSNHNDAHVLRVEKNALKIVETLQIKEVDINLLKVICLLHDFTYTVRKPGFSTYLFEGHIERKVIKPLLEKFELSDEEKEKILNAVFHHAHSFPFRRLNKGHDIYSKILQDADTFDYFDCMRIKIFMKRFKNNTLGNLEKNIGYKLLRYGVKNLKSFLNYPRLTKSFYSDTSETCLLN